MTLDEFLARIHGRGAPLDEAAIGAFEASIGACLPAAYRDFLRRCNGGHARGEVWFNGPTVEGAAADAGVHDVGGLRTETYLDLAWRRDIYQGDAVRIPRQTIWIMSDPFGNAICLGVAGAAVGQIWFWDHEAEPDPSGWDGQIASAGNMQLLTDSFEAFVAGLRVTP